jgi:hypothetical protein
MVVRGECKSTQCYEGQISPKPSRLPDFSGWRRTARHPEFVDRHQAILIGVFTVVTSLPPPKTWIPSE